MEGAAGQGEDFAHHIIQRLCLRAAEGIGKGPLGHHFINIPVRKVVEADGVTERS